MLYINDVQTQDDYAAELTLESNFGGRLVYTIIGQGVYAQFRPMPARAGEPVGDYTLEEFLRPHTSFIDKISGVRFRSALAGQPARIIAKLAEPTDPLPNVATPQGLEGALSVLSATDNLAYSGLMTHDRHTLVSLQWPYGYAQYARLLQHDDFNAAPIKWAVSGGGAVALSAVRSLDGASAMRVTSPGGAGGQGIARKIFPLAADQQSGSPPAFPGIHLIVSVWFNPVDANWRDTQIFVRPDDTVTRWQAALRFHQRQAGVGVGDVQYLDSGGAFRSLATYTIRDGTAAVSDPWHFAMLVLSYQQSQAGAGSGFLNYALVKFDDFTATDFTTFGAGAQVLATNGFRETTVDLIATTDVAAATAIDFDEFLLSDLAAADHLIS